MTPASMPDSPPKDTTTIQPLQMPSATTPPSPSPSREHDPLTGDSATGESPQSQAPRLSVVSLATTTPPATEPPNPEAGHPPPAQTPGADPSAAPASLVVHETRDLPHVSITQSQGASPSAAAPLEPAGTETGYPPRAPDPIEPHPILQAGVNLLAVPHDAQEHDVEAQRPWPARLWSWCGVPWTCHNTVIFVVAVVVGIATIGGVVLGIVHALNNRGTSTATNRQ